MKEISCFNLSSTILITVFKIIFIDLNGAITGRTLLLNSTFAGFLIVIASLAFGLHALTRSDRAEPWWKWIAPAILIIINVLALIALSVESNNYFDTELSDLGPDATEWKNLHLAKQLSISIIWAVYGGAMLLIGIWRRNRLARIMALIILSMTILKVFLFDLSSLDQLYRIISFVMLGIVLLIVSFVYQKLMKGVEGGQS